MVIAQEQRESSVRSSVKMKQWRQSMKEKLFMKKPSPSNSEFRATSDQGAGDRLVHSKSVKSRKETIASLYVDHEAQLFVMARAKEVQANLSPHYPTLMRVMLPSHVAGGFWLGLPKEFCHRHLPKKASTIVLVDESGKEYETKYLMDKVGLSGGWRGFSVAHKLQQGDVVLFHVVMPTKFMVYIVRSNAASKSKVDAHDHLKYDAFKEQLPSCSKEEMIPNITKGEMIFDNVRSKEEKNTNAIKEEENESCDEMSFSQVVFDTVMSRIELSDSSLDFDKVKCLNDFYIYVNGLIIDSEFSKQIKTKYYELCCSQKSFLHDHLLEGLNYKLVSGIISETVNIADGIRAIKISTHEYLATWDKTLKAFEGLGMNVSFLRSRIDQLLNLSRKPEKKREAKLKRDCAHEVIRKLETKLSETREIIKEVEDEIQTLDIDIVNMEQLFYELASAPW